MKKGQVTTAGAIVIAAITVIGGLFTAKTTASEQVNERMGDIRTDIAVLKQSDATQDETIREMKENVEYIRRSVEEMNKRQGIVIRQ